MPAECAGELVEGVVVAQLRRGFAAAGPARFVLLNPGTVSSESAGKRRANGRT